MACDAYREALAERVDGTLDPSRAAAVERHVQTCAACAAFAADLGRIREAARGLATLEPPPFIRERVRADVAAAEARHRRVSLGYRRLAVAASILLVVGFTAFQFRASWSDPSMAVPPARNTASTTAPASPARTDGGSELVQSIEEELRLAEEHYERAIAGLEQAAATDQQALDPLIAATLQKNLGVIDQAIDESRAALRSQPASQPARESLFEAFKNKVALLQDTVALINEMRKGDDAGTARMVSELAK
jgi:anti-sigma factor RsiW